VAGGFRVRVGDLRPGALVCSILAACALAAPVASASGPLRTATFDPFAFNNSHAHVQAFDRSRASGATMVRLTLGWKHVAPQIALPRGFDARDYRSPGYNWSWFDAQVRMATARGLEPFVEIILAPAWASQGGGGTVRPNPVAFGNFAYAAARRYSGELAHLGLPRIRYWQAWGEPNRDHFLMPQYEGGRIASALHYREMIARFSAGVYSARGDNLVIAGALSPLGRPDKPAPLAFMREMLCLSASLQRTCDLRATPVAADVWSHHAYTGGGPTRAAHGADNVSLGDLGDMRRYLGAAVRLGHLRPRGPLDFWVTEFGWDSSPPDPNAIPPALHARWTSHALYQMWRNDVSLATWWLVNDQPLAQSRYQSGFYTVGGQAKLSLTAFRFPTVAFRRKGRIFVWGRTPAGRAGPVRIQVKSGRRWRTLGRVHANGHGIFQRTFRGPKKGLVQARYYHETSVPFSLSPVRDRLVEPFGCGGEVRCR
jgi:hypothetical protein